MTITASTAGPAGQAHTSAATLRSTRLLGAGMLAAAGASHIPVIPSHLREAPYIGVLFILLTVACVVLAALLTWHPDALSYVAAVIMNAAAITAYVLSRTVGLPMIEDDIGNWFEPLGIISVLTEAAALLTCASLIRKSNTTKQ